MSVQAIGALLLISDHPEQLAAFYRDALALPIEEERHDDVPVHYGCDARARDPDLGGSVGAMR